MDETASRFQVRPHKEFSPDQGKEKLLSLRVISEIEDSENMEQDPSANAYEFMRNRNTTDPYIKKWAASIRTSNFANMTAPLCVRLARVAKANRKANRLFHRCQQLELSSITLFEYMLPAISALKASGV